MLATFSITPTLPTSDLQRARAFYEGTLGFSGEDVPEGVMYSAGSGRFMVYESGYAGTNKATAMAFEIPADSFDAEVADLRARGIVFDEFEMEGITWSDGVAEIESERSAWFSDPDGNIIAVTT